VRELQAELSADTIALEISSRHAPRAGATGPVGPDVPAEVPGGSIPCWLFGQRRATIRGRMLLNAVVCSRVRELQEALSAATIALEIPSRNSRVAALQKRWDRLRAGLDLIHHQRGADMADLPGGASGLLCRDYKGKKADRLVTRIDPGVVAVVAELRGHERHAAEELEQWKTHLEERSQRCIAGGDYAGDGPEPGRT
jgi:hypothetical protein